MEFLKIWTSFRQVIAPLTDSEKGRLFDSMLLYAETGEEPEGFLGNERFLWIVAKQDIDRTAQKCEILRQNGFKGGRPKSKQNQTEADETKENQTEPDETKENQTEPYNIKKSNIKESNIKESNKGTGRFTPPSLEEVQEYCRERKNGINAEHFIDYYATRGWELKPGQKVKDWKACIRTWEQREKTPDIRPLKKPSAQDYTQRDYAEREDDPDEVLAMLAGRVAR